MATKLALQLLSTAVMPAGDGRDALFALADQREVAQALIIRKDLTSQEWVALWHRWGNDTGMVRGLVETRPLAPVEAASVLAHPDYGQLWGTLACEAEDPATQSLVVEAIAKSCGSRATQALDGLAVRVRKDEPVDRAVHKAVADRLGAEMRLAFLVRTDCGATDDEVLDELSCTSEWLPDDLDLASSILPWLDRILHQRPGLVGALARSEDIRLRMAVALSPRLTQADADAILSDIPEKASPALVAKVAKLLTESPYVEHLPDQIRVPSLATSQLRVPARVYAPDVFDWVTGRRIANLVRAYELIEYVETLSDLTEHQQRAVVRALGWPYTKKVLGPLQYAELVRRAFEAVPALLYQEDVPIPNADSSCTPATAVLLFRPAGDLVMGELDAFGGRAGRALMSTVFGFFAAHFGAEAHLWECGLGLFGSFAGTVGDLVAAVQGIAATP